MSPRRRGLGIGSKLGNPFFVCVFAFEFRTFRFFEISEFYENVFRLRFMSGSEIHDEQMD